MIKSFKSMSVTVLLGAFILLSFFLFGPPARGADYSIVDNGADLVFPVKVLTGDDLLVNASNCPCLTVEVTVDTGWNVTLACTDFSSGGATIPSSSLSYTATGGTLVKRDGQDVNPVNGPRETGSTGTLNSPLTCLTCQANFGHGSYDWQPDPGRFVLLITADRYAGSYTATLTATISGGP